MGLLKIGSFYKKKSSQKKTASEKPPTTSSSAPTLPTLSLDAPLPPAPSSYQQEDQQQEQQITAGSGGLFDDILAELGSPPTKERTEGLDDFSLALALSHQLELETPSSRTVPKKEEKKLEKKAGLVPGFMTGQDSIYSSYLRHFDSPSSTTPEVKTCSMFDSILSQDSPAITKPSTTVQVLDSDVSDSDDQKKSEEEEEEEDVKSGRRTLGMQPIMERRGQGHRLKRKVDSWNHRLDPEAQRVESQESMIERMKDRHRQQAKWAALQRQQEVFRPVLVPPPYGVLGQPRMMDFPPVCHAPLPQEEAKTNESRTSLTSSGSASQRGSPIPPSVEEEEDKVDVTDGTEADVESSDDENSSEPAVAEKPKKGGTKHSRSTVPPAIQTMRSSRSAPNLKKKKRPASRRNSQENSTSTPPHSDYPLTPPAYSPHPPVRHMKSEPELINHRKRQQMQHHQQQLQFEWDRMQAYQREQQLKMMQQQQYMSMYPMMYYNPPVMMPSTSTLPPPTHPRMSHSYSFHTTR